jgi:Cys-tRNA(Pro)/Cys-tRNA(Cys) deacylase
VPHAATPAIAALLAAGVPHEVVKFAHDPGGQVIR